MSVYGPSAESVNNYMRKGSRVGVDGRLEWREWETADEQKRQAVSVVADVVQFLDSPGGGRATSQAGDDTGGDEEHEDRALLGVGAEEGDLVF